MNTLSKEMEARIQQIVEGIVQAEQDNQSTVEVIKNHISSFIEEPRSSIVTT